MTSNFTQFQSNGWQIDKCFDDAFYDIDNIIFTITI